MRCCDGVPRNLIRILSIRVDSDSATDPKLYRLGCIVSDGKAFVAKVTEIVHISIQQKANTHFREDNVGH